MTHNLKAEMSFYDLSKSPTTKMRLGKKESRRPTLKHANNSLDPSFNPYLTNYSSSVNTFMQKHGNIGAFAGR